MHSQVIFINRVLNPNRKATVSRNKTYLNYICTKNTVYRNENTTHGLFGKILGVENISERENSLQEVQRYIKKISDDKKNIYRSIISIKEIDAIEKGYNSKEKWEDLVRNKLPDFASKIGIKYENLEYVASVHLDRGHPHIHIMFWDRNQEVQKNFINSYLCDNFRGELNKYVFNEEYMALLKQKDSIKEFFKEDETNIIEQLKNEINDKELIMEQLKEVDINYCNESIAREKLAPEVLKEITKKIIALKDDIPKNGRINYQFLSKDTELIKKIDAISEDILIASPNLKNQFNLYIQNSIEIAKFKTKEPKELKRVENLATKDLLKQIGNKILNIEKELLKAEASNDENIIVENKVVSEISGLISLFSQLNTSYNSNIRELHNSKELTKEEKLEIYKKNINKSNIEW